MAVSELQAAPLKLALPLLDVGLLLIQLEDEDVELSPSTSISRAAGCCPAAGAALLRLLLQGGPHQLLLPGAQLLPLTGGQDQGHCRPPECLPTAKTGQADPSSPGAHTGSIWQFWGVSALFWGGGWGAEWFT